MDNIRSSGSLPLTILKWVFLGIPALICVPLWRLGKFLSKEAYKGLMRAIFNGLIGVAAATTASVYSFTVLPLLFGWQSLLFLIPASFATWLVTMFIAYPALYLGVIHPFVRLVDKIHDWTRDLAKNHLAPILESTVGVLKALPGSRSLWDFIEDKNVPADQPKKGKWVGGFLQFVSALGILYVGGTLGWNTFNFLTPITAALAAGSLPSFLLPAYVGLGLAIFGAATVAAFVIALTFHTLDKAELNFAAAGLSGLAIWKAFPLTTALVGDFGLVATIGAVALQLVAGIAYGYPAVHAVLKSGLMKAILDGIKTLFENTYDYKDTNAEGVSLGYRKFWAQVITIVSSLLAGAISFYVFSVFGLLPVPVIALVAVATAVVSYLTAGEILEGDMAAVGSGLVSAFGAGVYAYFVTPVTGWLFYVIVASAVILTFFVLYPLVHGFIRLLFGGVAKPAGEAMERTHEAAVKRARSITKWWETHVWDKAYEEKSKYAEMFVHAINIGVLGVAVWQALPLVSGFWGLPGWASIAVLSVAGFLTYMLLGRAMLAGGTWVVGGLAALTVTAQTGWTLYQSNQNLWWAAIIVALTVGSFAFYVAVPAALRVVRLVADPLLTSWLGPILSGIYKFFWDKFEVIADLFIGMVKWLWKFIAPIFGWLFSILGAIFKGIADVWNSMFGRR